MRKQASLVSTVKAWPMCVRVLQKLQCDGMEYKANEEEEIEIEAARKKETKYRHTHTCTYKRKASKQFCASVCARASMCLCAFAFVCMDR